MCIHIIKSSWIPIRKVNHFRRWPAVKWTIIIFVLEKSGNNTIVKAKHEAFDLTPLLECL